MLIFGGCGTHYNRFGYALDLTTMKWSKLNNVKYDRRKGHTANLIGNSIYLFGGWDFSGY